MSTTMTTAEFYHAHGYALPGEQLLPAEEFAALQHTFEGLCQRWEAAGKRPEHLDTPHFWAPELNRFLLHPAVLDVVESVLGPDIALFSSHFICKPAGDGKRVPWHEDSAYWNDIFDGMDVVTIWLAIDPSTVANGCMRVIPDTHHNGYSDYDIIEDDGAVFTGNIRPDQVDESKAVDCVLAAGEYSLHHAKTIHGSAANTSGQRRCGYTMRFVPTTSRFYPERSHKGLHQLYLARGVDRAGNDCYGDPEQAFTAWTERFAPGT
jgi:ectoine hydroxylase-related dioxygenase (phytanoyl-CoA dioxygenase family)